MPDISSMQGIVQEYVPTNRVNLVGLKGMIIAPQVKVIPTLSNLTIYDSTEIKAGLDLCVIQNVGTGAIMYAYNTVCTPDLYHGILAGGVATEDGLGSSLVIDKARIEKLSLWNNTAGDCKIAQFKLLNGSQPNKL